MQGAWPSAAPTAYLKGKQASRKAQQQRRQSKYSGIEWRTIQALGDLIKNCPPSEIAKPMMTT